jgi:hypothetical protein
MKAKKTISVEYILKFANEQLAHPNNTILEKMGIITMIEEVLHKSNAYKGYMYLKLEENNSPPALLSEGWATRKYF